jgi:hypothetical protein
MIGLAASTSSLLRATPLLAATTRENSYGLGIGPHASAVDSFTIFLLGLVLGILVTIAVIVWRAKHRNRSRLRQEIHQLMADSHEDHPAETKDNSQTSKPRNPWEKSDDWWKKLE